MAVVRTEEASSSTSRCTYHAFLSFRGKDTRKTFTDHLYTALWNAGIHTFRDDDELERGEDIELELQKAIQESRISIIVFSINYASSSWCLDELVIILRRKNTAGHKVLPVFYNVKPSQVRDQTGSFAKAFDSHEEQLTQETDERRKAQMEKVEGWRAALREVANLSGMVLENQANGHEAKFIEEIIEETENKLKRTLLSVALYPIGTESRVQNINSWLQDGSTDVGIGVISGMGGIGKTTTAKVAYNLNYERFKYSCFLANIREISQQPNGLVHLQRQLLSDISIGKREKKYNIDEVVMIIKDAISCKKILLVLDDVDEEEQLNALIGKWDWFYSGSKIIITTRREQLLKAHVVHQKYKIKELDDDESLQLFSWHAFGQDHPSEDHMDHSKRVIRHCAGLPLALEVMGSSLCSRSVEVWRSALEKLEATLHDKIQKTLEISYKSLPDDHDKNLFLHVASSFVGADVDDVVKILEEDYTAIGIQNLRDRSLITVDDDNKLMMHQLLQEMARTIARRESSEEPGKHGGAWNHKNSSTVSAEKTGTEIVDGLVPSTRMLEKDKSVCKASRVGRAKRQHSGDSSDESMVSYQGKPLKRPLNSIFSWLAITSGFAKLFPGKKS
ncbi:unnamed protein product [Ilex paraguariensis]|uniref:TIR domain-containing protein n=1 Tax=Ilex paraguariensis TaxID=185542 RepID=A0ABC8UE91_9AQUA